MVDYFLTQLAPCGAGVQAGGAEENAGFGVGALSGPSLGSR